MRTFHRILNTAFLDTPDHQPFDYDNFRERLAALPAIAWDEWFIAEVDGVPAGVLQSADQMAEANEGWVKNLAVAKEFRGRGVGRLLLQTVFATYAAKGYTAVGLGVDMTNPTGAYRLYESVGLSPFYEADVLRAHRHRRPTCASDPGDRASRPRDPRVDRSMQRREVRR